MNTNTHSRLLVAILLILLLVFSSFAAIEAMGKGGGGGHQPPSGDDDENDEEDENGEEEEDEHHGHGHDNIKDLIQEIPPTNETPLMLKTGALGLITSIEIAGDSKGDSKENGKKMGKKEGENDRKKIEKIIEHINKSIEDDLWWDEEHIKSFKAGKMHEKKHEEEHEIKTIVFNEERKAAQTLRELINREKKSKINETVLLFALIKLLQADQRLALTAIEDAKAASSNINDSKLQKEIEKEIEKAEKDYEKALKHVSKKGCPTSTIKFFEKAWKHASLAIALADKDTIPRVTIDSPQNNSYTNISFLNVSGSVHDVALYTMKTVTLTFNGASNEIPLDEGVFNHEITLTEGINNISVSARDFYNNTGTASIQVVLDTIPPNINITGVEDGAYYNTNVSAKIIIQDINLNTSKIELNGAPNISGTVISEEGAYLLYVHASDMAGNTAYENRSFVIDKTLPIVAITSPVNDSYLRQTVSITGSATDLYLDEVSLSIDGVEVAKNTSYPWDTTGYTDGLHTIVLKATDRAGNSASSGITVTVDNTLPEVGILSPVNDSYLRQVVDINASATDINLANVSMKIDGTGVSSSTYYNWDTTGYTDGSHIIWVTAFDRAGNSASASVNVIVDNTPPEVTIKSPPDGSYVRQEIVIDAKIVEVNLENISVKVNNEEVSKTLPYNLDTTLYIDGNHTIEISVLDKAGNTAFDSIEVTVDNTPPELYVSELNLYPTIDNPLYSLLINTEEDATITVNTEPLTLENGSATYSTNITLGVNNFVVRAVDLVGNPSLWEKSILVDEDRLPDWYEINVTGTDPLNADSDSSKTPENEASNNVTDDEEDFDSDMLTNLQEFRLDTDPFSSDTDGDGLTDRFEVFKTGTYPTSADSDNDSVSDATEDLDNDTLTNLQEQSLGTDPLNPDTDTDTLNDGYEISIGTNPLNIDTDGDGLDDDSELRLGTDPLVADTDSDGTPDGNETYTQTFVNTTAGVEATIEAVGDLNKTIYLGTDNSSAVINQLQNVTRTIEVSAENEVKSTLIKIYYNESELGSVLETELKMFYLNETTNNLELVEVQGVNTSGNYVWGNTTHLSIFTIASPEDWFNQWYVDWEKPKMALKPGEKMKVKVTVRNIGEGIASNVKVEFREDTKTGTLIGTKTISSINAKSSAQTSIEWTVKSGVSKICVNVDPDDLIVEVSEGNNDACKSIAEIIDSDGDGLTDYEEINGMRVAFPKPYVVTDPNDPDTDGDGLTDGEEMGDIVYDAVNKLTYDALRVIYGWPEYDGYHYEYKADPTKVDTDGDGLDDKQEIELELNPFVYSPYNLVEAGWGFLCGHACADNPKHENIPFIGGWMVSGFLVFGDIRDLPSTIIDGDWLDFGLTVIAIAPGIGDAESVINKLVKMATKSKKMMLDVFEFTAKSSKLKPHLVKAIDAVTGNKASEFIAKGAKEEDIVHVAKNRGNFKETKFILKDGVLKQTRWLEEGTSTWGWTHIKRPERWDQITSKFGPKSDGEVQRMIFETIESGKITRHIKDEEIKYTKKFLAKDGTLQDFSVAVSDRPKGIGKGNVLTAHPGV